jgi:FMN phosphatase YigB (HAD superfamily)
VEDIKNIVVDTGLLYKAVVSKNKKVVIFDIFDTIIHRKVHPEDLKKIFCDRFVNYFGLANFSFDQIYELRAQAERELCSQSRDNGFDLEFQFNEMCSWLYENLCSEINQKFTQNEFVAICREIEFSVEIANQYTDLQVVSTIQRLKKEGFTVLCCSDFYFDYSFIKKVLRNYYLDEVFEEIFVSSEYKVTKRSGRLYEFITQKYPAENCLMIGDNAESDVRQAEKFGIESILLDRSWAQNLYTEYNQKFNINSFQKKLATLFKTDENVLFAEFALTSFLFIQKLYFQLVAKGHKDAFFLAREGQVLKQMFDIFQKTCVVNKELFVTTHYLMASRRSTFIPSLNKLEKENFFNLFRQYVNISFAEFMFSLGFGDNEVDSLALKLGIIKNKKEKDFPRSETFLKAMLSDEFYDLYEGRRVAQKSAFKKYVHSFKRNDQSKLALIDVGWKGTIQDNIFKILDEEVLVEGFYMGLVVEDSVSDLKNSKSGLLFSKTGGSKFSKVFEENRSLFEVIYAANHGSVVSFNEKEDGDISTEHESFSTEEKFYKQNILPIIDNVTRIFRRICAEYNKVAISNKDLEEIVSHHHARIVLFPVERELDWHLNLYHVENFGVFERNLFNRQSLSISLIKKINNYIDYKTNQEKIYLNTIWPAAEFAKRGLKAPLKKYSTAKYNSIFK